MKRPLECIVKSHLTKSSGLLFMIDILYFFRALVDYGYHST